MPKSPGLKRPIRLRWILFLVYIVFGGVLLGHCVLHMGHSPYCQYAYYLTLPAGQASVMLLNALIPWRAIPQGPLWSGIEIVLATVPFVASCVQYYLVGLLLDKLLEYCRRKSN